MNKGTVKDLTFFSDALQEQMQLLIYIPANYSPLYKYNILIATDGKDYFQLGGIPRLADELIDNYEMEQTIIVGIPYKDVYDRQKKYIPSGEEHDSFLRFLAHELVPYLDEEFATYQLGSTRAVVGDSMAATAALMAAIKYPSVFGKAVLQSPYVDDLVLAAVTNAKNYEALFIYQIIGTGEDRVVTTDKSVKDFLTPNRALHTLLAEKNFQTFYEEFDGNHTWKYWKPDLKRALVEIFG
ncbi:alpha/beta hydrolase-fold protein [Solibacillus sp. CAU 1738]|uniref:alpha/beta hydrolase n=1 Tax=Solibacillus sp. CAU 1738 TaxID=3140363 RepID=UPI003260F3DA